MNNIKKLVKDTKTNKNTYFASENIGGVEVPVAFLQLIIRSNHQMMVTQLLKQTIRLQNLKRQQQMDYRLLLMYLTNMVRSIFFKTPVTFWGMKLNIQLLRLVPQLIATLMRFPSCSLMAWKMGKNICVMTWQTRDWLLRLKELCRVVAQYIISAYGAVIKTGKER